VNPVIIEHGIAVGGQIVQGTERVIRDLTLSDDARLRGRMRAYWGPGEFGTMARAPVMDGAIGHWTGGEAGAKSYEDDGPWAVSGTKLRKAKSGGPLKAAYHFVIGACAPDATTTTIWQSCDLTQACVHVGLRSVYRRMVGIEIVNAGLPGEGNVRDRPELRRMVAGRMTTVLAYYPAQLAAWVWLMNVLSRSALVRQARIEIPQQVPCTRSQLPLGRRFTEAEQRAWKGAQEHFLVPGTTKLDGGTQLMEALLREGSWSGITHP
jgi:hypothetical protein